MRQSARVRRTAMATVVGAATLLAPVWRLAADEPARPADIDFDGRMSAPGLLAEESGVPPPALRLRAIVARAWDDSVATWKRLMAAQAAQVGTVSLRFVSRLAPNNCYGLYAGEGPAYCSGNRTVFVGTGAANRLMARFGPQGEAGITFLIGHEIGHHIQNIHGRFQMLSYLMARLPGARSDLMRRFELEADCYAGVWIHASDAWSRSAGFRAELIAALSSIGDESLIGREPEADAPALAVHGTSAERTRWFLRGADSGDPAACNSFAAIRP